MPRKELVWWCGLPLLAAEAQTATTQKKDTNPATGGVNTTMMAGGDSKGKNNVKACVE